MRGSREHTDNLRQARSMLGIPPYNNSTVSTDVLPLCLRLSSYCCCCWWWWYQWCHMAVTAKELSPTNGHYNLTGHYKYALTNIPLVGLPYSGGHSSSSVSVWFRNLPNSSVGAARIPPPASPPASPSAVVAQRAVRYRFPPRAVACVRTCACVYAHCRITRNSCRIVFRDFTIAWRGLLVVKN